MEDYEFGAEKNTVMNQTMFYHLDMKSGRKSLIPEDFT